jgi:hypothetical protein
MSRRPSESYNAGPEGGAACFATMEGYAGSRLKTMTRPAGVTLIAITTFAGAAILALGSFAFFFVAVMAISGGDGGDPVPAAIAGMGVAGGFSLLVLAGVAGAWRWAFCNCANGREFRQLVVSQLELHARPSAFLLLPDTPLFR